MKPFNILAVDDEVLNLDSIERSLKKLKDFRLFKSSDPVKALDLLKKKPIQIIITDQRMPGMTGVEFLRRANEISPGSVRIILTAYPDVDEILEAVNLGHIFAYLTKPWAPEQLLSVLKQAKSYYRVYLQNQQLTRELQAKTELLEKQNRELQQFDELKNRFMIVASHELRTPATIITGSLELLASQKHQMTESQYKILQNALNGAYRLNEIIETFFEVIRNKAGESTLHPTVVNIKDVFDLVLNRFTDYIQKRQVKFHIHLQDNLHVMGDKRKLYLVFENLVSNALKFTPDGGKVHLKGFRQNGNVRVEVADSGIGIPPEEQKRIFQTFYQLENYNYHHTSRHEFLGGGTGLGLSLCKRIVEAHDGDIWCESPGADQGSSFFVELPAYQN